MTITITMRMMTGTMRMGNYERKFTFHWCFCSWDVDWPLTFARSRDPPGICLHVLTMHCWHNFCGGLFDNSYSTLSLLTSHSHKNILDLVVPPFWSCQQHRRTWPLLSSTSPLSPSYLTLPPTLVRFPNCIVYSWVYNTQKTVKFNFDCFHSLH